MLPIDFKKFKITPNYKRKAFASAIAINHLKEHFSNTQISGTLQGEKLFVNTQNLAIKIKIFKEKIFLIQEINTKIKKLGYPYIIKDIYIKSRIYIQDDEAYF